MKISGKLALLVAAVMIAGAVASGIAEAHSRPVRFDPAPGAVLDAGPSRVDGWFSSDLRRDPGSSFIHVFDASKSRQDVGDPVLSSDRRQMSAQLKAPLGPGSYLVHWSTFDDGDGEIFSGCYVFFVGRQAADAAVAGGKPMDGADACPASPPVNQSTVALDVKISGSNATLQIKTENLTVKVPDGSPPASNVGHFHIYLDQAPLDVLTGHSHDEAAGSTGSSGDHHHTSDASPENGPIHWYDTSYTFKGLSPGRHTVAVAVFHDHTTAFSPPVVAEKTFDIGGTAKSGGIEAWIAIVAVCVALAAGLAIGKMIASSSVDA